MKSIFEQFGGTYTMQGDYSDFSTTANIYAHLDYSSKISSAQAMENGLQLPVIGSFTSRWSDEV